MRQHIIFLFILFATIFASCSKMPIYQSKSIQPDPEDEYAKIETISFDKKNEINYGFAHNDSNFYIKATFHDNESWMKIMRGGLILYFDPECKKKKDYALRIERGEKPRIERSSFQQQNTRSPQSRLQQMPAMIDAIYTKVVWDSNGNEFVFFRGLSKYNIEAKLQSNAFNELELCVKMPLSEIPRSANNLLSLGIVSGSAEAGGRSNGGMRPGGMGGGHGGSGRGGAGGGGGRGGAGGGRSGGAPGGSASASSSSLQIWCQVQL